MSEKDFAMECGKGLVKSESRSKWMFITRNKKGILKGIISTNYICAHEKGCHENDSPFHPKFGIGQYRVPDIV